MGPTPYKDSFDAETDIGGEDPLGKYGLYYCRYDAAEVEWVLENVFNCSQTDISNLRSSLNDDAKREYYFDGYYYSPIGGSGYDFKETVITDITPDGNRYRITYEMHGVAGYDCLEGPYSSVVERKQISGSGKGYWSLYYYGKGPSNEGMKESSRITVPFWAGDKIINMDIAWDPATMFADSPNEYKNDLAIAGLVMSWAAEDGKSRMSEVFSKMGFEEGSQWHRNYEFGVIDPAVSFAAQDVVIGGKQKTLIACVVRGTIDGGDRLLDISSVFKGFSSPSEAILGLLEKYLTAFPGKDVILFVTS